MGFQTAFVQIFYLLYLLLLVSGITLLIWGFVTVLRIQKNTRETNERLNRVIQLLEQQASSQE